MRKLLFALLLLSVARPAVWAQDSRPGTGLRAEYFNNQTLTAPPFAVRQEANINFTWGNAAPFEGMPADHFSIRWSGTLTAPMTGNYLFHTTADDGVRLWLDDKLLIDNWTVQAATKRTSSPVTLTAGTKYNVKMEYFENAGNASVQLRWTPPGGTESPIPTTILRQPAAPTIKFLSDMGFTTTSNGDGPVERDQSAGGSLIRDGKPLSLKGISFAKGLGAHADSDLTFRLGGLYSQFETFIGIDDEITTNGSAVFRVYADGVKVYESPRMKNGDAPRYVFVDVRTKNELRLTVTADGDTSGNGHADWADAHLTSGYFVAPAPPTAPPTPTAPAAPTNVSATGGVKQIALAWTASSGATGYKVFRGFTAGGEDPTPLMTVAAVTTFTDTTGKEGVKYFYKIAATNAVGDGPLSAEVSATVMSAPAPPPTPTAPVAPTGVSATGAVSQISLAWTASSSATGYKIFRGLSAGGEATTPLVTLGAVTTYADTTGTAGTKYFYQVAATNAVGDSPKSAEVSATVVAPTPPPTPNPTPTPTAQLQAVRFLRQATWGPNEALITSVKTNGMASFVDAQLAAAPSQYPDMLLTQSVEYLEEHFFRLAMTGDDQLRQRTAWAWSMIFVVSADKVDNARAMVPYAKLLSDNAFGNFYDLMRAVTLNPAMGQYLDFVNNGKEDPASGIKPNENYSRELMQLFTIGLVKLNQDGTPILDTQGQPIPTYGQSDVKDLARAFTGWTYNDNLPGKPGGFHFYEDNLGLPLEDVNPPTVHDMGAKTILGQTIPAGGSTVADLDAALRIIFNHPNVPPFICKQLIQHLVTSNPSPTYVRDIAQVFINNGQGVRGDIKAVVRAILLHPEAQTPNAAGAKLQEPVLYISSVLRALEANVADHPFMSDFSDAMGQKIYYAPSVFNYFSPAYRVPGTALTGPEFQIYSNSLSMVRANFAAQLVSNRFGADVAIDYTPFTALASNPSALLDKISNLFMGGLMPTDMRTQITTAMQSAGSNLDKVRTAIYLTITSPQYQVER